MKRVVTIQDISCIGKCSLTVALPIISAMGVETAIIPTAVLSTHTMFSDFTFHDLTQEIEPICAHWKKENMKFDAVYTGYLGSFEQIQLMKNLFTEFKTEQNLLIVDPAMGDNGSLYKGFDEAFAKEMGTLCGQADIILPNMTEACMMTGTAYRENPDQNFLKEILHKLLQLGAKNVVLTGISPDSTDNPALTGVCGIHAKSGEIFSYTHKKQPKSYHGTGDIFSSTLTGSLMRGASLEEAVKIAADFTAECIRITIEDPDGRNYGVNFEEAIPFLVKRLEHI